MIYVPEIGEFVDEKEVEVVNEILRELKELKKKQQKAQILEKLKTKGWAEVLEEVKRK